VAIEAMSVGTPVIHTDGGALTEIVGDTGILLPDLSADALSSALSLLQDREKLGVLSRKSHSRYTKLYTPAVAEVDMQTHIASVVR
jgi:glycosyltransferase involved in cell wall biosynthesis